MTAQATALLRHHLPEPERFTEGEAQMLPALMHWLVGTGRLRGRTIVAYEVPWVGRRVDLALLTARGKTTAFELKIGRLQRVMEQAAYNHTSFHRSWVVTGNHPRPDGLAWASELGIGLLVVQHGRVRALVPPADTSPHPDVTRRLRRAIRSRAT